MIAHLDLAIFPRLIEYFSDYQVLYCHACTLVYFLYQLDQYLAQTHGLAKKARQPVIDYCQTLPVVLTVDALTFGRDSSLLVPFLPILARFACSLCRTHSQSKDIIQKHVNKIHQYFRHECAITIRSVQLQS